MARLTTDELNTFKKIQSDTEQKAESVGRISIQYQLLKKQLERAAEELDRSVVEQEAYLKMLYDKYGEGSLDIETGEITS